MGKESKEITSKVYFGAKQIKYTGADELNKVGRAGVLIQYIFLDAPDECAMFFHTADDDGSNANMVRHSRSRFVVSNGKLTAKSITFGSEKVYQIADAVEAGPEVFEHPLIADVSNVPDEWQDLFTIIYPIHSWLHDAVRDTSEQ